MHNVAILGGGPAGITAALYCARYRLDPILISDEFGGQVTESHRIENYLGFDKISGMELSAKFRSQLEANNVKIIDSKVKEVKKTDNGFLINGDTEVKTLIISFGMKRRKLNIKGEDEFYGKGVSYCATCDAAFFRDKTVCVIGGNDGAAVAADILSQHAKKVSIIYRKEKIRAEPAWLEKLEKNPKIEIITNVNVTEILGTNMVESVNLDNGNTLKVDGVFIEIGSVPSTAIIKEIGVDLNEKGFVMVGNDQKTSLDGVYAAGDITTGSNSLHQIITAASEGAIAAESLYIWLKKAKINHNE